MTEGLSTLLISGDLHPNTCGFVTTGIVLMIFITSLCYIPQLENNAVEGSPLFKSSRTLYWVSYYVILVSEGSPPRSSE